MVELVEARRVESEYPRLQSIRGDCEKFGGVRRQMVRRAVGGTLASGMKKETVSVIHTLGKATDSNEEIETGLGEGVRERGGRGTAG